MPGNCFGFGFVNPAGILIRIPGAACASESAGIATPVLSGSAGAELVGTARRLGPLCGVETTVAVGMLVLQIVLEVGIAILPVILLHGLLIVSEVTCLPHWGSWRGCSTCCSTGLAMQTPRRVEAGHLKRLLLRLLRLWRRQRIWLQAIAQSLSAQLLRNSLVVELLLSRRQRGQAPVVVTHQGAKDRSACSRNSSQKLEARYSLVHEISSQNRQNKYALTFTFTFTANGVHLLLTVCLDDCCQACVIASAMSSVKPQSSNTCTAMSMFVHA